MSKYSIFLVDDDIKYLTLMKLYLEENVKQEIEISIFAHGENALAKINDIPDIVVLDYHLDGINDRAANGLEILKKIRSKNDFTKVLMLTGNDELSIAREAYNNGAYEFVNKSDSTFIRLQHSIDHILTAKKR